MSTCIICCSVFFLYPERFFCLDVFFFFFFELDVRDGMGERDFVQGVFFIHVCTLYAPRYL